jgi:uncharacterized protein with PQ loop repeat
MDLKSKFSASILFVGRFCFLFYGQAVMGFVVQLSVLGLSASRTPMKLWMRK